MRKVIASIAIIAWSTAALAQPLSAQETREEPIGGQPPAGATASVTNLEEQLAYQRAFEATVWAMPALGIYGLRKGFLTTPP